MSKDEYFNVKLSEDKRDILCEALRLWLDLPGGPDYPADLTTTATALLVELENLS